MAKDKVICLTDEDGVMRYFKESDLNMQLALAVLPTTTGAVKAMLVNVSQAAKEMRAAQKQANGTTTNKRLAELEKKLDDMLGMVNFTLEKLN